MYFKFGQQKKLWFIWKCIFPWAEWNVLQTSIFQDVNQHVQQRTCTSSDWILSIRPISMAIVLPKLYQRSWSVIHISINQLCKRFQPTSMVNTSITTMQTSHLSPKMHSVSETVISHWLKGFLSTDHWLLFPLQPCIALFIMPETNLFLTSRQELVYFNAQKTKRHEDPN